MPGYSEACADLLNGDPGNMLYLLHNSRNRRGIVCCSSSPDAGAFCVMYAPVNLFFILTLLLVERRVPVMYGVIDAWQAGHPDRAER